MASRLDSPLSESLNNRLQLGAKDPEAMKGVPGHLGSDLTFAQDHIVHIMVNQKRPLGLAARSGDDAYLRVEAASLLHDVPRREGIVDGHNEHPRLIDSRVFQAQSRL